MVDVIVIGGGIAGVSAAYELAERARVTLLEQESALAYHTTGRSAALFVENYGVRSVGPLTRSSRSFFDDPPEGLVDHDLLSGRGAMTIAREDQEASLEALLESGTRSGSVIERQP